MDSPPTAFEQTRTVLHRVAAHVLGRRCWDLSGCFGLRAGARRIAAPAFGPASECVRTAGTKLPWEVAGVAAFTPIPGASLRTLATFAGV